MGKEPEITKKEMPHFVAWIENHGLGEISDRITKPSHYDAEMRELAVYFFRRPNATAYSVSQITQLVRSATKKSWGWHTRIISAALTDQAIAGLADRSSKSDWLELCAQVEKLKQLGRDELRARLNSARTSAALPDRPLGKPPAKAGQPRPQA